MDEDHPVSDEHGGSADFYSPQSGSVSADEDMLQSKTGSIVDDDVSVEQAVQGLLKAIAFLDAHPVFSQRHIKTLWTILELIKTQDISKDTDVSSHDSNDDDDFSHLPVSPINLEHNFPVKSEPNEPQTLDDITKEVATSANYIDQVTLTSSPDSADNENLTLESSFDIEPNCPVKNELDETSSVHSTSEGEDDGEDIRGNDSDDDDQDEECDQYSPVSTVGDYTIPPPRGNLAEKSSFWSKSDRFTDMCKYERGDDNKRSSPDKKYESCDNISDIESEDCDSESHTNAIDTDTEQNDKDNVPEDTVSVVTFLPDTNFDSSVECKICGRKFNASCDLKRHMHIHTSVAKKTECTFCGRSYKSGYCLKKHMIKKHKGIDEQRELKCTVCDLRFISVMELHQHRRHEKHYQCGLCNEGCNSMENLIRHMNRHDVKKIPCKFCEEICVSARGFVNHTKRHTGEELHVCTECGKSFVHRVGLANHMRVHQTERTHKCSVCLRLFKSASDAMNHYRRSHGEKKILCMTCGKKFRTNTDLRYHMRGHTGEKPYVCTVCGKGHRTRGGLEQHKQHHTGERKSQCSLCGQTFMHEKNLRQHLFIHSGEKPHKCDECGKRFIQLCNLRTHMRTHTGQKPFQCNICSKAFSHSVSLRGHMKYHEGKTTVNQ